MAKKKEQIPAKTCSDCVHEFACQMWNVGNIHNMGAERCSNHETVKESPAYLVGIMDGRAEKKTNADRIRAMSDEELEEFAGKVSRCAGCPPPNVMECEDNCEKCWEIYLRRPAEED